MCCFLRRLRRHLSNDRRKGVDALKNMMDNAVIFRWYDRLNSYPTRHKQYLIQCYGNEIHTGWWDDKCSCWRDRFDNRIDDVMRWADVEYLKAMPSETNNYGGIKNVKRWQD